MSGERSGGGKFWFGLLIIITLAILFIAGSGGDGVPYDPRSVQPNGAKGLVDVLKDLGAEVSIDQSVPGPEVSSAVVLRDRLSVDDRNALLEWVGDGGVLVVADPFSPLNTIEGRLATADRVKTFDAETCDIERLAGVKELELAFAFELAVDRRDRSCFGDGEWAQVVETSAGDGSIVAVGGQQLFSNEWLDEADAAVVAVSLLAADPQGTSVAVIAPSVLATDEPRTLTELFGVRVRNGLLMAGFAFLLYAFYRGRRLGSVVNEPLPIPIRGSELVLRHGHLEHRSDDPGSAAAVLRTDFVRRMATALRLNIESASLTPAERTGALRDGLSVHPELTSKFDAVELHRALAAPVQSDEGLVAVAQLLARIERAVLHPDLDEPSETNDHPPEMSDSTNLADATTRERLP